MPKVKENQKILPKLNVLQENLNNETESNLSQSKIKIPEKWKKKLELKYKKQHAKNKEKKQACESRPNAKKWRTAYNQKWYQNNKERIHAYLQKPEVKARRKECRQKWYQVNKQKIQKYYQRPEVKYKKWAYEQKPEVKARKKEYNQKWYQNNKKKRQMCFQSWDEISKQHEELQFKLDLPIIKKELQTKLNKTTEEIKTVFNFSELCKFVNYNIEVFEPSERLTSLNIVDMNL